jgi:hypothetical protein
VRLMRHSLRQTRYELTQRAHLVLPAMLAAAPVLACRQPCPTDPRLVWGEALVGDVRDSSNLSISGMEVKADDFVDHSGQRAPVHAVVRSHLLLQLDCQTHAAERAAMRPRPAPADRVATGSR